MKKLSEAQKDEIMLLRTKGLTVARICEITELSNHYVRKAIIERGDPIKRGKYTPSSGKPTKKEQCFELWNGGLHNVKMIGKKVEMQPNGVRWVLNRCYGIKTKPIKEELDKEIKEAALKRADGTLERGAISNIARRHGISRQAVFIRFKAAMAQIIKQ